MLLDDIIEWNMLTIRHVVVLFVEDDLVTFDTLEVAFVKTFARQCHELRAKVTSDQDWRVFFTHKAHSDNLRANATTAANLADASSRNIAFRDYRSSETSLEVRQLLSRIPVRIVVPELCFRV